jgi:hypothetical protein
MPARLAACDPCRIAKVSCDHAAPCGRCREYDRTTDCIYRERPFKRRRVQLPSPEDPTPTLPQADFLHTPSSSVSTPVVQVANVYPNPGYQGMSSHTSIFDQVKASGGANVDTAEGLIQAELSISNGAVSDLGEYEVARHTKLLGEITQLNLQASTELISRWTSQGA